MLTAIGLALDVVGAIALVIGLLRPVRPTTVGYAYAPDDAARDAGFGVAGVTLLVAGFFFQSLGPFGVSIHRSAWLTGAAVGSALIVGTLYALVVYEITHRQVFDRRRADALRKWPEITPYSLDRRRGLWFWRPRDVSPSN